MGEFGWPSGMGYTGSPDYREHGVGFEESGFNDAGVGISATETIVSNAATLKVDPYNKYDGIVEEAIPTIILPQARTARDGVLLLGSLIERYGSAEGFGVAFVDKKEAWYLENAGGHEWAAERIPDDSYFVSANQSRIGAINFKDDENVLTSPNLKGWAIKNHLFDPMPGRKFIFRKIFGRDTAEDAAYNYPRVAYLQARYTGSLSHQTSKCNCFPTFAKPDHLITVADVENSLKNHFEGTPRDPYELRDPSVTARPISVFRTYQAHVLQTRANLPPAIANVEYLSLGMSALSIYLPFYYGSTIPGAYDIGSAEADDKSAFWQFRKVQTLAMQNYPKFGPMVIAAYGQLETEIAKNQKAFERQYIETYSLHPHKAQIILNTFTRKTVNSALRLAEKLSNQIITEMAIDVNKKYLFEGA